MKISVRVFQVVFALALFPPMALRAESHLPFHPKVIQEVDLRFMRDGRPDPEKLSKYRNELADKAVGFLEQVQKAEEIDLKTPETKAVREARAADISVALDEALLRLDQMILVDLSSKRGSPEFKKAQRQFYQLSTEVLQLDQATFEYYGPSPILEYGSYIWEMMDYWNIPIRHDSGSASKEARNLYDARKGSYLSEEDLRERLQSKDPEVRDLSLINPRGDGVFWRDTGDISKISVRDHYYQNKTPMWEGLETDTVKDITQVARDGSEYTLERVKKTQTKPKFEVRYLTRERQEALKKLREAGASEEEIAAASKGLKVKIKVGSELNAEPAMNAILSVLGYNADVNVYVENIKVNLGDVSPREFVKDWRLYFDRQFAWIRATLADVATEDTNTEEKIKKCHCVKFKRALVEMQHPDLERVGGFDSDTYLPLGMREARAFILLNMWFQNTDVRKGNNKVVLRRYPDGSYRMFLMTHDTGHSLGALLSEEAGRFPKDILFTEHTKGVANIADLMVKVKDQTLGEVTLSYFNVHKTGAKNVATYYDLKWIVRRMAQLTEKQIRDAVALGAFDRVFGPGQAEEFTRKLLNRRDQLVEVFGLAVDESLPLNHPKNQGRFALFKPDFENFNSEDGQIVKGKLKNDPYMRHLLEPLRDKIVLALRAVVQNAVCQFKGAELTIQKFAHPEVLYWACRQVKPVKGSDKWVTIDSVHYGFRMGLGHILRAEGAKIKKFAVVRLSDSREEALTKDEISVANFTLWASIDRDLDPDFDESSAGILDSFVTRGVLNNQPYVLFKETLFEKGFKLDSSDANFYSPIGTEASLSWISSDQLKVDTFTQYSKAPTKIWVGEAKGQRFKAKAQLDVFLGDITLAEYKRLNQDVNGIEWVVNDEELLTLDGKRTFYNVVVSGKTEELQKIAYQNKSIEGDEVKSSARASIPFIIGGVDFSKSTCEENIYEVDLTTGQSYPPLHRQCAKKCNSWWFLDRSEEKCVDINLYVNAVNDGTRVVERPMVVVNYSHEDSNTSTTEFADGYWKFLQTLGSGQDFVSEKWSPRQFVGREFDAKDPDRVPDKELWNYIHMTARVAYYGEAIDELLKIGRSEEGRVMRDRFLNLVAERLSLSRSQLDGYVFAMASQSPDAHLYKQIKNSEDLLLRIVLRSGSGGSGQKPSRILRVPLKVRRYVVYTNRVFRELRQAHEDYEKIMRSKRPDAEAAQKAQLTKVVQALYNINANVSGEHTYNGDMVSILHKTIDLNKMFDVGGGKCGVFMEGRVGKGDAREKILDRKYDLVGQFCQARSIEGSRKLDLPFGSVQEIEMRDLVEDKF